MADSNQEDDTKHIKAIIINVKNRIELCLLHYLNQHQILEILQKEGMLPSVVNRVWEELKRNNREFFSSYYTALHLIDDINNFNDLAEKSYKMLRSMNSEAPLALTNHVHAETEPNIMQNNMVLNTWMNYQEPQQQQQQQPQMVFPPQKLTNPGVFLNMCDPGDQMQFFPCTDVAPPPMNNNSFEGNIVANQVSDMSQMNNVLQDFNMTAMDNNQVPIFNENNHLGNMGNLSDVVSSEILALLRDN